MTADVHDLTEKRAAMRSLQEATSSDGVAGGGGGPHDPDMDARVSRLEDDVKAMRSTLDTIAGKMDGIATKADVTANTGETKLVAQALHDLDTRLGLVQTGAISVANAAVAKNIGPWQLPGVIAACVAASGAALGALALLARALHLT